MFCFSFLCPSHGVRRRSSSVCPHHLAAFGWRLTLLLHTLGAGSFLHCLAALLGLFSGRRVPTSGPHRQHVACNRKTDKEFWGISLEAKNRLRTPHPRPCDSQATCGFGKENELLEAACQCNSGTQEIPHCLGHFTLGTKSLKRDSWGLEK